MARGGGYNCIITWFRQNIEMCENTKKIALSAKFLFLKFLDLFLNKLSVIIFFCLKTEMHIAQCPECVSVVICIILCYRRNGSVRRNGSAEAKRFCRPANPFCLEIAGKYTNNYVSAVICIQTII